MELPIENLKPLIRCPSCQKAHDPGSVAFISEDDRRTVLHLSCKACEADSLIFVSAGKMGVMSFGTLTDLSPEEARKFSGIEAVSRDEALVAHRFFRDFDGSLAERLF